MGMYDTINSEQVKCFYWTHYYNPNKETDGCHLCTSGGNLYYFGVGDTVPFKSDSYNYTKDFLILDAHFRNNTYKCPSCLCEYYNGEKICSDCGVKLEKSPAIVHIIRDGKVKETLYLYEKDREDVSYIAELNEKLFKQNNKVIAYYGDRLNIHSVEEIFDYTDNLKVYMEFVENSSDYTASIQEEIAKERKKKMELFLKKDIKN